MNKKIIGVIVVLVTTVFAVLLTYTINNNKTNKNMIQNANKNATINATNIETNNTEIEDDTKTNTIYNNENVIQEESDLNSDGTIKFKDAYFENAIRSNLNLQNAKIYPDNIKDVKELKLDSQHIENLAGIEYFENLEELNLMDNYIKDISPLKKLTNLKKIFLSQNNISDISVLSNLSNLEILNIENNDVTDINPICKLEKLSFPTINGNPIMNYNILLENIDKFSNNDKEQLESYGTTDIDNFENNEKENKKNLYEKNQIAINKMQEWVSQNINNNMIDLEKEYKIINHLIRILTYDSVSNVVQTDIYGAYIDGHAVCFEYALLFQYLAKMSGIESYQVSTNLAIPLDADTNVQNHVWNIVKIDSKYYQLDITWADDLNPSDYSFINISDETMQRLHRYTLPINKVDLYPSAKEDMPTNMQEKYYNE